MYAPINIKTDNYLLHSMIKIDDLIKYSIENNIKALTITDNNMYGALEFYLKCKKNNIKPIIGIEINIPEKIILYAMNYEGYKNLMKLTHLDKIDDLIKYSNDLVCLLPYESRNRYNEIKKIYNHLFITYKNEEEKNKIKLHNTLFSNEILCLKKEDEKYLKYLKAIKEGKKANEIDDFNNNYLIINKENNNEKLVDLCNLEIKMHQDLLPIYTENSYNLLKQECIKGMKRIFGSIAPKKYALRLKYELEMINKMGFNDYFLIVADYVKYAKENNILVGPGRGSAAGSLVAYTLNITTIDPLKYDLLFERFLNPERITMPDIDVDFEDTKRDKVITYCINKYDNDKVSLITTFGTLASKQAVRDVCKIFDIDSKKTDYLSKLLNSKLTLKQNYQNNQVKKYLDMNSELKTIYKIASKIEGIKRHTSIHPAGIVMSKYDLSDYIPLDKTKDNINVSEYDKDYLEPIGLLKMDFLSLKNLTLISNILEDVKINFDDIKEDDKKAINIFTSVNTSGIFQFESEGMKNFLRKFKINSFNDITAAIALFRPGPINNIDTYIRRKEGKEKIDYYHPSLEPILKPTYGIIVYQEQIMQIANVMAGYSLSEADLLRRAMSKKNENILLNEKDKFINGSIKNGYSKDLAIKIYDMILKFSQYGFNHSHSVAYSMISYRMAYLKAYYPYIFMKHLLNSVINSEIKTKEYLYECKKNGIEICMPNINLSDNKYVIKDNKLIFPLTNIKGVGINLVNEILKEREEKKFTDIFDFVSRVEVKNNLENLIYSGVFDEFENRQTLIKNIDTIINYGEIGKYNTLKPELKHYNEFDKKELMNKELEVFGFYLSNHPVSEYKNIISLKNINSYFDKVIDIVLYVDKTREIDTKNKEKMMFITASDELSQIDLVIFPKVYNNISKVKPNDIIKIKGRVEKRFDQYQIVVNNLVVI